MYFVEYQRFPHMKFLLDSGRSGTSHCLQNTQKMSHLNMCNLTTSFYPFLQAAINTVHPLLSLVLKSTMYNGKSVARFARNVVKRDYFE